MAMHTETALRLPTWLIAALVVLGLALGLWQVGAFDRSTKGASGVRAHAAADQARNLARTAASDVTAVDFASLTNRATGGAAGEPMNTMDQLASNPDPEAREESIALQDALAAEQASH